MLNNYTYFVRMRRIELLLLAELDPKSSASTNSATPAASFSSCKNTTFFDIRIPVDSQRN